MIPATMKHYVTVAADGNVHVTNAVGGFIGQHHVHTPEDFERWKEHVAEENIVALTDCRPCDCDAEVRS